MRDTLSHGPFPHEVDARLDSLQLGQVAAGADTDKYRGSVHDHSEWMIVLARRAPLPARFHDRGLKKRWKPECLFIF